MKTDIVLTYKFIYIKDRLSKNLIISEREESSDPNGLLLYVTVYMYMNA